MGSLFIITRSKLDNTVSMLVFYFFELPGVSDSFDLTRDSFRVSESLFELTMSYISFSSLTERDFFLCCSCCFWSCPSLGEAV